MYRILNRVDRPTLCIDDDTDMKCQACGHEAPSLDFEWQTGPVGTISVRAEREVIPKFYQEIECEHGWTDDHGFAHCNLGSGCSISNERAKVGNVSLVEMISYCTREDCPIMDDPEYNDSKG